MSQTTITLAFEQWKAQQGMTGEPVLLDEFVFASVPGLNPDQPIDRSEAMPPADQIVYRQSVTRKGVVNENAVVHSVVLGADVGDFSFNWIGLINKASGTLAMIVHAPVQQKLKTKEGQQGNVLTRSFLMEYNGAQTETGINTPAETWQIDFTARMAGMDERQRLENIDIYGAAAFFGDGWLVGKNGNQFYVTSGAGYVAGLRAQLGANQNITVTTMPVNVWLDVCWVGTLASAWEVQSKVTVAESLADYEQNGVKHRVFALASIDANGGITDLRPKGSLGEQQASREFLRKDANLSDIRDAVESRKHLGLKGAAVLDVGRAAGTVAAGDDTRIVNALQKGNNLSDLEDKALSRASLELGSAATRDVADNASGALVPVGYKGNFKSECNHGAIDFATYPFVVGESLFIDVRSCTNNPPFLKQDFYFIDVICATNPAQGGRVSRPLIQFVSYGNSTAIYSIREDDGTAINWRYFKTVQFDASGESISINGGITAYSIDLHAGLNALADIYTHRNIWCDGIIQAQSGVFDSPGIRVYSPNNPPPGTVPAGVPIPWPGTPPGGWDYCAGQPFNGSLYPQLAAAYPNGYIPDMRGVFIRGWDNGRGIDPGRAIMSLQYGQAPASGFSRGQWGSYAQLNRGINVMIGTDNDGYPIVTQESESQRETRPINVAFNYIVRLA